MEPNDIQVRQTESTNSLAQHVHLNRTTTISKQAQKFLVNNSCLRYDVSQQE